MDDYWLLLRDAYLYRCGQTEQGREYLEKCWYLEQEQPDRGGLRQLFSETEGR